MSELKQFTVNSKVYLEDSLSETKITKSEEENLERVFNLLLSHENEPSSDENETKKKYLKEIKRKVEEKRIIHFDNTTKDKTKSNTQKTFSIKAIRKVLRKYLSYDSSSFSCINKVQKEDFYLMIWEYDQDLDFSISRQEFENMYKRCIKDEKEKEPKRLYYLVLFMMFDKDEKYYIIEEDALEILYIRYKDKFEDMLNSIFAKANKGEVPNVNVSNKNKQLELRKALSYKEFIERMTSLSLVKRKEITKKKKNYCNYIHEILKDKGLPIVYIPRKK